MKPQIDAIITESKVVHGEYSLKAITPAGQRTLKLLLKDAGFTPGDHVQIRLASDWEDMELELENNSDLDDLKNQIDDLERIISRASDALEGY